MLEDDLFRLTELAKQYEIFFIDDEEEEELGNWNEDLDQIIQMEQIANESRESMTLSNTYSLEKKDSVKLSERLS